MVAVMTNGNQKNKGGLTNASSRSKARHGQTCFSLSILQCINRDKDPENLLYVHR